MEEITFTSILSFIVDITPIFISCIAIWFTKKMVDIQKEHNVKSVRPIGRFTVDVKLTSLTIYIENIGLGPMLIETFNYRLNGKKSPIMKDFFHNTQEAKISYVDPVCDLAISSNSTKRIFEIQTSSYRSTVYILEQLSGLQMHMRYKDIYDNIFELANEYPSFKSPLP